MLHFGLKITGPEPKTATRAEAVVGAETAAAVGVVGRDQKWNNKFWRRFLKPTSDTTTTTTSSIADNTTNDNTTNDNNTNNSSNICYIHSYNYASNINMNNMLLYSYNSLIFYPDLVRRLIKAYNITATNTTTTTEV